ncbi:RNA polymerase sigma factor, sigma-70 family [Solitalea canadensis DSM 3403]|uniref:RNA polymerase sigma factor, sigma-70 family n=1 Tax=Solitalea canadensis (strain ATCC 29591 / DSM 3403 / JCM 21819 / LMG 8368 / NBRC 15130 / NCIMB 12057 / USAM 9D) TaxID=929556 RepID=H8KTV0_SOLCM|nr:RNA polymerase sigma factor, sigma-70 family [Solitalea canadensis DSM 3403]
MIKNSYSSDNEIIQGILKDSEEALRQLYKQHFPVILQFILNNNGDEEEAKDVYQEAIIILYDKVKSGSFELNSKLKTFIYSVCRRLWLKRLKSMSRKAGNIADYEEFLPIEDDLEHHEAKDAQLNLMEGSLAKLGEPCKTIIEDYYLHNQSMQDIAEKFGYTNAENAKNQKYKCLMRLKKIFFQANIKTEEEYVRRS